MDRDQVLREPDGTFRCRECGFRYALSGAQIAATCTAAVVDVGDTARAIHTPLRERRPAPAVWSPNAYCAHLAEATELIELRVRRIATEDRPQLAGYDQDAAADDGGFDRVPMERTMPRIEAAVARFVSLVGGLGAADWQRIGVHEEVGEVRLVDIAHDMPHELTHHADDLRRIGAELAADTRRR